VSRNFPVPEEIGILGWQFRMGGIFGCVRTKSAGEAARLALLAGSLREGLRVRAKQARKGREGFWPR